MVLVVALCIYVYVCIAAYLLFSLVQDGEDRGIVVIVSLFWPILIVASAIKFVTDLFK